MKILTDAGFHVRVGRALSFGSEPDLIGLEHIHLECKRAETIRLHEWMSQAERDSQAFGDGFPALMFRRSREPWYCCMKLTDWLTLYRAYLQQTDIEN